MVSEKIPSAKRPVSQLKLSSVFGWPLLNEATLEPLLIQLTWTRNIVVWSGRVALQGRVAFALRPACTSLRDTVKRVGGDQEKIENLDRLASNRGLCCSRPESQTITPPCPSTNPSQNTTQLQTPQDSIKQTNQLVLKFFCPNIHSKHLHNLCCKCGDATNVCVFKVHCKLSFIYSHTGAILFNLYTNLLLMQWL